MPRGRLGRPGVVVIPRICRDTVVERLDTEWVAKELGQVLRWEIRIAMKVSPLIALYGPEEPGGQRLTATDYLCMLHLTKILSQDWHWPGWKAKSMNRSSQTSYRYCEPLESLALFQGLTNVSALQQCFQSLMARPIMQGERLHACLSYICCCCLSCITLPLPFRAWLALGSGCNVRDECRCCLGTWTIVRCHQASWPCTCHY